MVSGLHQHHGLAPANGLEELPTFSGGHHRPDPTTHVEGATRIESPSCIGCLVRQRLRADTALAPALGGVEPSSAAGFGESDRRGAHDPYRLPAPRAPPTA